MTGFDQFTKRPGAGLQEEILLTADHLLSWLRKARQILIYLKLNQNNQFTTHPSTDVELKAYEKHLTLEHLNDRVLHRLLTFSSRVVLCLYQTGVTVGQVLRGQREPGLRLQRGERILK